MMQLSLKNNDSSLCYDVMITHQILKIDNFGDFSCDIDYNRRAGVFRYVISLIINQWAPRRPQVVFGEHKVSASRAAQTSDRTCFI